MRLRALVLGLLLAAVPTAALANVIFPAVILTGRLLAWWIIGLSVLIEAGFVRLAFKLTARDALFASLAANALSAAVGLLILPYAGLFAELGIYHSGLAELIGFDTFNLQSWLLAFVLALVLNLAVELAVYRYGYGLKIDRRAFWLIALANTITAGIALASLWVIAAEPY